MNVGLGQMPPDFTGILDANQMAFIAANWSAFMTYWTRGAGCGLTAKPLAEQAAAAAIFVANTNADPCPPQVQPPPPPLSTFLCPSNYVNAGQVVTDIAQCGGIVQPQPQAWACLPGTSPEVCTIITALHQVDPNILQTVQTNAAAFAGFVQKAIACNLQQQPPVVIQQAWALFLQNPNADPCPKATPVQPLPTLPKPQPGTVTTSTTTTTTPASTNWPMIALGVAGVAALGAVVYFVAKKPAHAAAMENPHISYASYRASIADQLMNKYGMSRSDVSDVLDLNFGGTGGDPESLSQWFFKNRTPPTVAAKKIYAKLGASGGMPVTPRTAHHASPRAATVVHARRSS